MKQIIPNLLREFPTETMAGGSLDRFCCCGSTLAIGTTFAVLLFELADVTILTLPRTILCEIFVATGNVPPSVACAARDVSVSGTTVGFCCAF